MVVVFDQVDVGRMGEGWNRSAWWYTPNLDTHPFLALITSTDQHGLVPVIELAQVQVDL